jgi:RHS repeat-associated protein
MLRFFVRTSIPVFALCIFGLSPSFAQITNVTDDVSKPIEGAGHDYIHMLSETVNPSNGSVSLRIHLPVPKARGITVPFAFSYDSNGVHHLIPDVPGVPGEAFWRSNTDSFASGGWSYSYPSLVANQWTVQVGVVTGYNGSNPIYTYYPCNYQSDYLLHDLSGGTHALGVGVTWSNNPPPGDCPGASVASSGDQNVAAQLPYTPASGSNPAIYAPLPATVYDEAGTIYYFSSLPGGGFPTSSTISGLPTYIEDRNGNKVMSTQNGNTSFTFTDTAGRAVVSVNGFGPTGTTNTVSAGGLTYSVTWKTISANFSVPSLNIPVTGSSCTWPGTVTDSQMVISEIVLPDGQAYTFYYGSDNPDPNFQNPYGLLSEIIYPSGGWVKYTWKLSDTMNEFADYPGQVSGGTQGQSVQDGCLYQYKTPVVATRAVGFGGSSTAALTQAFNNYSTSWSSAGTTWTQKSVNVTTTDDILAKSALTQYSYTPITLPTAPFNYTTYPGQVPVEASTIYYDWGNTTTSISTVNKTWYDQFNIASEQTILNGNQASKITYCYVGTNCTPPSTSPSQLQTKSEYDTNNNLVRTTSYTYQSFSNTVGRIVDRPCKKVISNGSGSVAETDFYYDGGTTLCAALSAAPALAAVVSSLPANTHDETNYGASSAVPRGNATTVTRLCLQSCTASTTSYKYDETGQMLTETDPCGNATCSDMPSGSSHSANYSYADSYTVLSSGQNVVYSPGANTNTYLTTITDALGHTQHFTYDFNNGQLTASKDQNNLTTTYVYNDAFARPTLATFPDGGSTNISYNDSPYNSSTPSPSVTTTKAINSSTSMTTLVAYDGLGHAVQSRLTTDPDGTTYTATNYDGMGHAYQPYNATRCNPPTSSCGESTWGYATSIFDALGRLTQVTRQDGSIVSTSYSGNCSTVTDEAGHARTSCTDGLGRLVEVQEPGGPAATSGTGSGTVGGSEQSIGGTPAASGTGTVTFSGTLQSKLTQAAAAGTGSVTFNGTLQSKQVQTQPAAPGAGSVTVSGTEQSVQICTHWLAGGDCGTYRTQYDAGTVSITVNSFTKSTTYGTTSTSSTIASALASAFNSDSTSPVSASASGSVVSLTSKTSGASTNYTLSATSSTNYLTDFGGPSFTTGTSGSTLTGGHNTVYTTVYDSGICTITVNSHGDSSSWSGSGTTTPTIASALVSSINGDSGASVSASASGGTVSLMAKTTGANTNYSLSSSCSYDSSNFSGPSFSTSNSGSSLTGGQNSVTVYDSGVSTITVNGHADSTSWSGSGTTTSTIASALAAAINADSAASVTASVSGPAVSLAAKTTGASTNYSLSSSSTYDSTHFSSASFTDTNSGSTLTGGSNGTATVYDSGTVWINVAGFQASAPYGQNSTSASVAAALATALNTSSSPVTASVSGTTLTITANAAGANTNYSLTGGSSTNQPSSFSHASFSVSVSGAALTGGTTPGVGTTPPLSLSTPINTAYVYDALDNLLTVTQSSSRQRTFTYDSLSRLVCASNPENSSAACPATAGSYTTGTTGYSYDANGNLMTKVAPAENQPSASSTVTSNYSYDALNRLTQKSFTDGTPTISYGYDGNSISGCTLPSLSFVNGIGRRTGMCDAAGSEAWSYPITSGVGWLTTDVRNTKGITLTTSVQNNLAGSLYKLTYPSTDVYTYTTLGAGRPVSLTDSNSINFASSGHYWPSGALASLVNGTSLTRSSILNSRLQPCWLYDTAGAALSGSSTTCSSTAATGSIFDVKYNFNFGTTDNGNVIGITNNRDSNRSESLAYDPLNRLVTAQTTATYATSSARCWGEAYNYDPWGNLLSISLGSTSYVGCTQESGFAVAVSANNQIKSSTTCFNSSGALLTTATYCYDAAGNLMTNTSGASFSYDAENHIESVMTLGISYLYDGDGRRVAKLNSSSQVTKLYWYGTGSNPLDETDRTGANNNGSFYEYAFFNETRIARRDYQNNVDYYFGDNLGSARVVTNSSGTILDDSDFYPFGGERVVVTPSSGNSYLFTGKERDSESGLDDFDARYYSSSMGRFMSPDWSATAVDVPYADFSNPQSLNLYSYVKNNPLSTTDPDGHCDANDWCGTLAGIVGGLNNAVNHAYYGIVATLKDPLTPVSAAVQFADNGLNAYEAKGVSGVLSDLAAQGREGATEIVTEAVLTGGLAAAANAPEAKVEAPTATVPKEGIYEGPDATAPGKTYVGQSGNIPERLAQHGESGTGKFPEGTKVSTTEVKGGKTAREIAEQKRIDQLGGVRSKPGSQTSNIRNPIGPKRKDLVNNP